MSGKIDPAIWEERQGWVRRQQESGLSAARFCRENGLHVGNFHTWRRKLVKDSRAQSRLETSEVRAPAFDACLCTSADSVDCCCERLIVDRGLAGRWHGCPCAGFEFGSSGTGAQRLESFERGEAICLASQAAHRGSLYTLCPPICARASTPCAEL